MYRHLQWTLRFLSGGVLVLLLFLVLGPTRAQAQTNATTFDARQFHPVTNPHGLIGLHTSRALRHLSLYGQLSLDYANDEVLGQVNGTVKLRPIAHRFTAELGLAFGLFGWLEVAAALPIYLAHASENFDPSKVGNERHDKNRGGSPIAASPGDVRLMVKARIMDNARFGGFGLGVLFELSLPTGKTDVLAGNTGVVVTPQLILDYRHTNGFLIALNAGARLRSENAEFFNLMISHELRFGVGVEVPLFFSRLSLVGEGLFAIGISPGNYTASELRTGLRWRHDSGLVLTGGVGLGVTNGPGAPEFRFFLDVRFGRNVRTGKADEPWFPDYGTRQPQRLLAQQGQQTGRSGGTTGQGATKPVQRATTRVPPPQLVAKLSDKAFDQAASADPDTDGDGIPNRIDKCPNEPETFNGFQDDDGCPDTVPDTRPYVGKSNIKIVKGKLKIDKKVYFNSGSDELKPRSFEVLREVALFIKASPQIHKIQIEGHTDSRGDKEMNVDLSERRARQVVNFLIKQGVSWKKLTSKGFGPKYPIATNNNGTGRALNRRVDFKVLGVTKQISPTPNTQLAPKKGAK